MNGFKNNLFIIQFITKILLINKIKKLQISIFHILERNFCLFYINTHTS